MRDLEQLGEVQLTRYGKPVAVLLSAAHYQLLQRRQTMTFQNVLANLRQAIDSGLNIKDSILFDSDRHEQQDRDFTF